MLIASDELKEAFLNKELFCHLTKERATLQLLRNARAFARAEDACNRALEQDINFILPNQVLTYEDRLSMANSLEIRSPFLDYRLVEYVTSLPGTYKVREGESKYLLKKAAEGILPTEMIYRPKQGFVMPIHDWMDEELREFMCDTLSYESLKNVEYLDAPAVGALLEGYFNNPGKNVQLADVLWNIACFVAWYKRRNVTSTEQPSNAGRGIQVGA
jgi:asparagine synthase (glutamine-hydrolysing)